MVYIGLGVTICVHYHDYRVQFNGVLNNLFFRPIREEITTEKVEFPITENVHKLYIIEPNFM